LFLAFILSFFANINVIIGLLTFAVLSQALNFFIAEKYTCGKIKITVDNEAMFFEWPEQIPFENILPMSILFTDITYYDFLKGGRISCPGFRFFRYPFQEFFEVRVPMFTSIKKKSSYSDFRDFLTLKSKELTNEEIVREL
jgi:hypothetical protein